MQIKSIYEKEHILVYLRGSGLLKQYYKAKLFLQAGISAKLDFKQRHPKGSGIWSFRINKQFRAFCVFDSKQNLIVFKIDNHQ